MALVILLATLLGCLSKAQANGLRCVQLFEPTAFRPKPDRLYDYYLQQIALLSTEEVQALNHSLVETIQKYVPPKSPTRAQAIDLKRAQQMLDVTYYHPIIGFKSDDVYMRPGEEMGFCFGRAMYLHLLALKLGVQKESIKKIWAVGPMKSDSPGNWGYHVGLLIFSAEGWIVLDTNMSRPYALAEWVEQMSRKSEDGRIRFYATEPEKFGLYAGKYSRYLLGLDLMISDDWFNHYFVDMLQATRNETLESLGMTKIIPPSSERRSSQVKSFSERLMDWFGL